MVVRRLVPAGARRFGRDVLEAWNELPRIREGRDGVSAIPGAYFIKAGYVERTQPEYDDLTLVGANWQTSVYARARELVLAMGARRVIDVGCGDARNHRLLQGIEVVGLDYGKNLAAARVAHPEALLLEVNLEDDTEVLPVDFARSIVVCADVIEHLQRPERLLAKLRQALARGAMAVLISTPDRDLSRGRGHFGPSPNTGHVREWNRTEFGALLAAEGYQGTTELVQSNDRSPERKSILAIVTGLARHPYGVSNDRP